MPVDLKESLDKFVSEHEFKGKGPLCVALIVTQHAKKRELPLDPENLLTEGGGQVLGLGKSAVQSVLKQHGIERVLAAEGGRTSRGSLNNMRGYVAFLNEMHAKEETDLRAIEAYWIGRVRAYFAAKPFTIKLDASFALRHVVRDILAQAIERQKKSLGTNYAGATMQHLVGAKLDCALGAGKFEHNSFSTSDAQSNRVGDFSIEDVAIHVTTAPGEAVIERCRENLNDGHRPILVTTRNGTAVAEGLAENKGIAGRIDIFEIEQFVALNLYELGKFAKTGRTVAITEVVNRYNEIIDKVETDPSMKIKIRG